MTSLLTVVCYASKIPTLASSPTTMEAVYHDLDVNTDMHRQRRKKSCVVFNDIGVAGAEYMINNKLKNVEGVGEKENIF